MNTCRDLICSPGCIILTVTRRSSFNVSGETLHSVLFLPLQKAFIPLESTKLIELQRKLRDYRLVFIHEYTMIDCEMFGRIDSRLRQATGKLHQPFGGISIVLVGDACFWPVRGRPLWNDNPTTLKSHHLAGLIVFKLFDKVVILGKQTRENPKDI